MLKERFLWIGIVLAILSGIGNYIYFQVKQLEEPLFLEHYYKQDVYDQQTEMQLTFYYLTNKQNPSTVQYAKINGIEVYPSPYRNITFWEAGDPQINFQQEFNHYYIVPVTFDIPIGKIPFEKENGKWSFGKMKVVFSDHQEINADIGKVEIVKGEQMPSGLVQLTGISNSSGESNTTLEAEYPVDVEEFSIPFTNEIENEMAIKLTSSKEILDGLVEVAEQYTTSEKLFNKKFNSNWDEFPGVYLQKELFPFHIPQGEYLEVSMKFAKDRNSYLDFPINITGTAADGKAFNSSVLVIEKPAFSQRKITEIIAEKKAGDSK